MTWGGLTTSDVETITGQAVTSAQLAEANGVITIFCNRTESGSAGMGTRDLEWLKQATAWQAAFQSQKPGFETREGHTREVQDGYQTDRGAEHQVVLAPLAARALRNLSWKGARSVRIAPVTLPPGAAGVVDFTLESSDRYNTWCQL